MMTLWFTVFSYGIISTLNQHNEIQTSLLLGGVYVQPRTHFTSQSNHHYTH